MKTQPAEVVGAKLPVYEIELDLSGWNAVHTQQAPNFAENMLESMPALKEDGGLKGKPGGFIEEVQQGTSFAYVIEHVILLLLRLAKGEKGPYTGWTRRATDRPVYMVRYSAPDFLTGRLAAILAIDLVKKWIAGDRVDVDRCVQLMKRPDSYFSEIEIAGAIGKTGEPLGVIRSMQADSPALARQPKEPGLTGEQMKTIAGMMKDLRYNLESITSAWRESFLAYGGNFGAAVIDKLELLNLDRHFISIIGGNFQKVASEIKRTAKLIQSYNIPMIFVVHSLWLFKNKLLSSVMDKYKYQHDTAPADRFFKSMESFYQIILQNVTEGFHEGEAASRAVPSGEFRRFIELNPRKGLVLVIDDDEMIRRVVSDILEPRGYPTLLAKSGRQALRLLEEGQEEISLVLLDVRRVDDDITIKEIYSEIKALCENARFIVTSGFSVPQELEAFLEAESIDFLKKPFTVPYLMNKIESVLF